MSKKPGMMIYFDMIPAFENMTDEDRGKFFLAMLYYSHMGVVPELDAKLQVAWMFMAPKLDADTERYEKTALARKYATYCRASKKHNTAPIPFEDWLLNYMNAADAEILGGGE